MKAIFNIILASILCLIVLRKSIPFIKAITSNKLPELVFVLGGDIDREIAGMEIAKQLNLPLLISSGSNPEYSDWLIKDKGMSSYLIRKDYRAEDTLTNFTSLIDEFNEENISHLLLVTSDYHIERAKAIGYIIAGSRGIKITSLSIPCSLECIQESNNKKNVDIIRSIAWVITGRDLKQIALKLWDPK